MYMYTYVYENMCGCFIRKRGSASPHIHFLLRPAYQTYHASTRPPRGKKCFCLIREDGGFFRRKSMLRKIYFFFDMKTFFILEYVFYTVFVEMKRYLYGMK